MEFRCPYCGEPAVPARSKWGIVSRFGTAPRCPHCKHVAVRSANTAGSSGYHLLLALPALLFMACMALAYALKRFELIPVGLLLLIVLYLLAHGLFSHFDKMYPRERKADPVFHFESETTEKLWPAVRPGEIYVIQFPREGIRPDAAPRVIGLIHTMKKTNGRWRFAIRVISETDHPEIEPGTGIRLVTEGMLVVPGTILDTAHPG